MKPLPKLLMAAALLLGSVGLVVAIVQPGDLGGDDGDTETAQPALTETETETETATDTESDTETDPGTETGDETTTSTTAADSTSSTTPTSTPTTPSDPETSNTTTTTQPSGSIGVGSGSGGSASGGSGLDGDRGLPSDLEDGLANTGGTSAIGTAVLIGLAGLALRRRST